MRNTIYEWVQMVMGVGIALAVVATYLVARANKRLGERIQGRRQQRREEAETVKANVDALSGRPQEPCVASRTRAIPKAESLNTPIKPK